MTPRLTIALVAALALWTSPGRTQGLLASPLACVNGAGNSVVCPSDGTTILTPIGPSSTNAVHYVCPDGSALLTYPGTALTVCASDLKPAVMK